jgi:UDP-N-acetylmuramate dehydrogenase
MSLNIQSRVSLQGYSTMGLGGNAAYLVDVQNRFEVIEALSWAQEQNIPALMIGTGSNVVWRAEGFPGLLIVNRISRFEVFEEDEVNVYVTIGAGENWDAVVARCVSAGYSGIEALSLIPGTAGATPIQNVGAYGQEIANTLVTIEAFDTQARDYVTIAGTDCGFGYRTSRFKTADKGRFFITAITLHLMKENPTPPFYAAVDGYFREHGITEHTPQAVRDAVIAIRTAKLPDPAVVHNSGSFFANPIVAEGQLTQMMADVDGEVPHWAAGPSTVKLSAAWLIDQAGFKDFHDAKTGVATWPTQSLVLINEHAKTTDDLMEFKKTIVDAVQKKFEITLVQEPELLP